MNISIQQKVKAKHNTVWLADKVSQLKGHLSAKAYALVKKQLSENSCCEFSILAEKHWFVVGDQKAELLRKEGAKIYATSKSEALQICDHTKGNAVYNFTEGFLLASYDFLYHKTSTKKEAPVVSVISSNITKKQLVELTNVIAAVFKARDWVNHPVNYLNTQRYLEDIKAFRQIDVKVDILRKSKLEALNMGGILGVNKGSNEEPAFVELTYAPKNAKNKRPLVFVGKGILFDTGGINIKTGNFMTDMKADMGGSATVLGALHAIAINKLPVFVKLLLPITENRINGDELVPGDVITMHNGKTVEVLNTDAEGRLVLADALSYAKKLNPELVIDAATLTGSAARTTGPFGGVVLGTDNEAIEKIKKAGEAVYERFVELPMWEEFEESLKSDVADLNNLGSGEGQAVCAGFFLKNFIDYKWVHLDIAGPAYAAKPIGYVPKGGTGFGVRMLYAFVCDRFNLIK